MTVHKLRDIWRNRRNREAIYCKSEYWDARAVELQGDAVSMWPNNNLNVYYHREQVATMEKLLGDIRGLRMLDIGCGTGRNSRFFADRGVVVLGIDFSQEAIAIARQKSTGANPAYRVQSVFDLDERDSFDAAVCCCTLALACRNRGELTNAVTRIARALKPAGKLFLCEPIHRGFLHRVLNMGMTEFSTVLEAAGFEVQDLVHLHFWPLRLALASVSWPRYMTAAGYYMGRGIMELLGNKSFGDYKVIYASLKKQRAMPSQSRVSAESLRQ